MLNKNVIVSTDANSVRGFDKHADQVDEESEVVFNSTYKISQGSFKKGTTQLMNRPQQKQSIYGIDIKTTAVDFERQNESQQDLMLSPIGVSKDKAKGSTKLAKLLHDNEKLAEDLHVLNKRSTVFNKNHQYHNKTTKNTSHG